MVGVYFLLVVVKLNGGSLENFDFGFEVIKKIVFDIKVYYMQVDQIIVMFECGEVDIVFWYQDRVVVVVVVGVLVVIVYLKEGVIGINVIMVILKGVVNLEGVYKYIDMLFLLEVQKCLVDVMYEGLVNIKVLLIGLVVEVLFLEIFKMFDFLDFEYVVVNVVDWCVCWQCEIIC